MPAQLPADVAAFTGRTGELAERAHRGVARAVSAETDLATARRHYDCAIAIYAELGLAAAEGTEAELRALS